MLADIRNILIISTPNDIPSFEWLFGMGEKLGLNISYAEQEVPRGIADAFLIGESFIGTDDVCLILGDNLFYGHNLTENLQSAVRELDGAFVYGYPVNDLSSFGVCEFDNDGKVISIEGKTKVPNILGKPHSLITYVKDRPGYDRRYAINSGKLQSGFAGNPKKDFSDGIKQTVKWYCDNPEWVKRIITGEYRKYNCEV